VDRWVAIVHRAVVAGKERSPSPLCRRCRTVPRFSTALPGTACQNASIQDNTSGGFSRSPFFKGVFSDLKLGIRFFERRFLAQGKHMFLGVGVDVDTTGPVAFSSKGPLARAGVV
jgi:hypothetical protein